MNWRQWLGLCESKGHKRETLEAGLKHRPGFSSASLSKKSKSTEQVDEESLAFAWALEVLPGSSDDFELYWRGLAALGVEVPPELRAILGTPPPPPRVDPKKLVGEVVTKLDELLVTIAGKLDTLASSLRGKLDTFTMVAVAKLDSANTKLDTADRKLDTAQATLNHSDAKIDLIEAKLAHADAKRDADTRKIIRAVQQTGGLVGGLAVFAAVILVHCQHAPTTAPAVAPPAPNVTVNLGTAMGGAGAVFDLQALLRAIATGEMGEKVPPEQYVPNGLLPGQKPPPCDARLHEEAINGGCWTPILMGPPCDLLFRNGNICYRPIAADPKKPVMVIPRVNGQESR